MLICLIIASGEEPASGNVIVPGPGESVAEDPNSAMVHMPLASPIRLPKYSGKWYILFDEPPSIWPKRHRGVTFTTVKRLYVTKTGAVPEGLKWFEVGL